MTALEILQRTLDSLSPATWCKGEFAIDAEGDECEPSSLSAVAWDFTELMRRAAGIVDRWDMRHPNLLLYWEAHDAVYSIIQTSLTLYSDSPETTIDDLRLTLMLAIESLSPQPVLA